MYIYIYYIYLNCNIPGNVSTISGGSTDQRCRFLGVESTLQCTTSNDLTSRQEKFGSKKTSKKTRLLLFALHVVSREVQLGFRIADFFVVLWDLFHFKKVGCSVAQFFVSQKTSFTNKALKRLIARNLSNKPFGVFAPELGCGEKLE